MQTDANLPTWVRLPHHHGGGGCLDRDLQTFTSLDDDAKLFARKN